MIYKALKQIQVFEKGYLFYTRNMFTGQTNIFPVTKSQVGDYDPLEDVEKWRDGMLIQRAFPYLYPNERELLLTGMLPDDWENMDDLGE